MLSNEEIRKLVNKAYLYTALRVCGVIKSVRHTCIKPTYPPPHWRTSSGPSGIHPVYQNIYLRKMPGIPNSIGEDY
jgi:hypothetical protein